MDNSSSLMQKGFQGLFNPEKQFQQEEKFGRKILAMAWTVEIIAATTGLIIAWVMAYTSYDQLPVKDFNGKINAFLGALPFIVIAIIELAKIPLAGGLYKTKLLGWKILIFTALALLTLVTFETMYTGLERQQSNINSVVTRATNDIRKIEDRLSTLNKEEARISNASEQSTNAAFQTEINSKRTEFDNEKKTIREQSEAIINGYEDEINRLQKELARLNSEKGSGANQQAIDNFDKQISDLNDQISNLDESLNTRLAALDANEISKNNALAEAKASASKQKREIETSLAAQLQTIQSQKQQELANKKGFLGVSEKDEKEIDQRFNAKISSAERDADNDKSRIDQTLINQINRLNSELQQISSEKTSIRTKHSADLSELQKQRSDAQKNRSDLLASGNKSVESQLAAIQADIKSASTQINTEREKLTEKLAEVDKKLSTFLAPLEKGKSDAWNNVLKEKEQLPDIRAEIATLTAKKDQAYEIKREKSEQSQIYRLAKMWFAHDDISQVNQEEISIVSNIWFGSIALIISTIGTTLALISYILRDPEAFAERKRVNLARRISRVSYVIAGRLLKVFAALASVLLALSRNILAFAEIFKGLIGKPLQRSFRRMFIDLRKRFRKPKIVIEKVEVEVEKIVDKVVIKEVEVPVEKIIEKEVPVEKIVFKEVPKEVVRKEIVYVPLYSTDSGLIEATKETLSKMPFTPNFKTEKDEA